MHGGATYRVTEVSVTATGGMIELKSAEPFLRTNAYLATTVQDQGIFSGYRWTTGDITLHAAWGQVSIIEVNHNIDEVDERTGEVRRRWTPEFNRAQFSDAQAFWLRQETGSAAGDSLAALQNILRLGVLFSVRADAHDTFSHSVAGQQQVYICENYAGGIGIVQKVLEKWRAILQVGLDVAEACACKRGCPNCIVPPRFKQEVDKRAGISLARAWLHATRDDPGFEYADGLWERREEAPVVPKCIEDVLAEAESQRVEFKSSAYYSYKPDVPEKVVIESVLRAVAGFLNAGGGTLAIGIADDGKILGIQPDLDRKNMDGDRYVNSLTTHIERSLGRFASTLARIQLHAVNGVQVALVHVAASPEAIYAKISKHDRAFLVRVNNSTRILEGADLVRYVNQHWS